jgi:hypothetical protein
MHYCDGCPVMEASHTVRDRAPDRSPQVAGRESLLWQGRCQSYLQEPHLTVRITALGLQFQAHFSVRGNNIKRNLLTTFWLSVPTAAHFNVNKYGFSSRESSIVSASPAVLEIRAQDARSSRHVPSCRSSFVESPPAAAGEAMIEARTTPNPKLQAS